MELSKKQSITIQFLLLLTVVIILSTISTIIWGGKPEKLPESESIEIHPSMTLIEFGSKNEISNPAIKKIFGIRRSEEMQKPISSFSLTNDEIIKNTNIQLALFAEDSSKDWNKIVIKFTAWFIFMGLMFYLIQKGILTPSKKKWMYGFAIVLFGIILGSDPSPMGTIKDAITLYGIKGAYFAPRMIALTLFLLTVILANKFICSWGCQFGALQDFVFRINRNKKDSKGLLKQFKIPHCTSLSHS